MGYKQTVITGFSWSAATRWLNRAITLAKVAVLARLLTPGDLGTFAVCTLALALLELVTETWINVFLITKQETISPYIDTAWVISIVRGVIISLLILVAARPLALFFNNSQVTPLLVITSLVPALRGFINPGIVLLQKDFLFAREFWLKTALFMTETIASITLVLIYRSPLALVWAMVAASSLEVFLSFIFFSPQPKFRFDLDVSRQIVHRGKWITVAGILNYLYQHGDDIMVGRILGQTPLGYYDYAYKISSLPLTEVGDILAKVTFPVYVRMVDTKKRLASAFILASTAASSVAAVLGLILFIFATPLVTYVLGENWLPTIPVLKVLVLYGVAKTIVGTSFPLFLALKKEHYITLVTASCFVVLAIFIVPFINLWGLVGAGLAATIGSLVSLPVAGLLVLRLLYANSHSPRQK